METPNWQYKGTIKSYISHALVAKAKTDEVANTKLLEEVARHL